jgi:hypothetical protein
MILFGFSVKPKGIMTMKKSEKLIILVIIICVLTIIFIVFRTFIQKEIFKPLALAFWLMLRVFVLSIDQAVLWWLMIGIIIIVFIFNLNLIKPPEEYQDIGLSSFHIHKYEIWESYFQIENHDLYKKDKLKKELARILVFVYATGKRLPVDYRLFDAFKNREINLPENIYSFLFTAEKKKSFFNLRNIYNKLSGREAGEYKRNLEECLIFLENFMEIHNE